MKLSILAALLLIVISSCADKPAKKTHIQPEEIEEIGVMHFPEGEVQHVVHADEINWGPCPPGLPDGCSIKVLEGSPKEANLFSVRFKMTQDFFMPAHSHPKDERVTILEGNAYVAFGKGATKEDATLFRPGDYYVNARNEIHTVWADSGAVLQITGIGPWEVDFVE